jgi:beta-lactamase class D
MPKTFTLVFLALVLAPSAKVSVRSAPRRAAVTGECFLFSPLDARGPAVSDEQECRLETAPASTFKIPHALIALETDAITPATVFKWDGTQHGFESWRRDHTLESAIRWSVVPYFQWTAQLIGRERMRTGLSALEYATDTFDGNLSTFWLDGDLVVSPLEQFAFLRRLFSGDLPVEVRHRSAVEDALRMPAKQVVLAGGAYPFALDWPAATIVRAKTGNTTVKGERVSWLVGQLELNDAEYIFVARVRSSEPLAPTAGAELARRRLNAHARPDMAQ